MQNNTNSITNIIIDLRYLIFSERPQDSGKINSENSNFEQSFISYIESQIQNDIQKFEKEFKNQKLNINYVIPFKPQEQSSKQLYMLYDQILSQTKISHLIKLVTKNQDKNDQNLIDLNKELSLSNQLVFVSHNPQKLQQQLIIDPEKFKISQKPIINILYASDIINIQKKLKIEQQLIKDSSLHYYISLIQEIIPALIFIQTQKLKREQKQEENIINVGYFMKKKKLLQNLERSSLLLAKYPLKFTPIDLRHDYTKTSNNDQIPLDIDIFMHKVTQYLHYEGHKKQEQYKDQNQDTSQLQESNQIESNFNSFCQFYKNNIAILDRMEKFDHIQNRDKFQTSFQTILECQEIQEIRNKYNTVLKIPKYLYVPIIKSEEDKENIIKKIDNELGYPFILKTVQSATVANSHKMAIILSKKGFIESLELKDLQGCELIAQQFINHDCKIHKVYNLGDLIDKQARPSIPNLPKDFIDGQNKQCWFFDSQKSFASQLPIQVPEKLEDNSSNLNIDILKIISEQITKNYHFTLYGYDILVEQKQEQNSTENWYICDLNYFPGFKGIPNCQQVYLNHFKKLKEQTLQNQQ